MAETPEDSARSSELDKAKESARGAARASVIQDLAGEVQIMVRSVNHLREEVEEFADKNNTRWFIGRAVVVVLAVVTVLNVYAIYSVYGLQQEVDQEVQDRSVANCRAIQTSKEAMSGLVEALRLQAERPLPETDDPELQRLLELGKERNLEFFESMDQVINNIRCEI